MRRSKDLQKILTLDIYDEALVEPDAGEELPDTVKRLKMRVSKYRREHDKSFVVEAHESSARVTRIPLGSSKRYWRWIKLELGENLVLCEAPKSNDIAAAYQATEYLNRSYRGSGHWHTQKNRHGCLVAFRTLAEDGTILSAVLHEEQKKRLRNLPPPPPYIELERQAANWRATAEFNLSEARRASGGTKQALIRVAGKFNETADSLLEEATLLRAAENQEAIPQVDHKSGSVSG